MVLLWILFKAELVAFFCTLFIEVIDVAHDLANISEMFNMDINDVEQMLDVLKDNGIVFEDNDNEFSEAEKIFYSRAINKRVIYDIKEV